MNERDQPRGKHDKELKCVKNHAMSNLLISGQIMLMDMYKENIIIYYNLYIIYIVLIFL